MHHTPSFYTKIVKTSDLSTGGKEHPYPHFTFKRPPPYPNLSYVVVLSSSATILKSFSFKEPGIYSME